MKLLIVAKQQLLSPLSIFFIFFFAFLYIFSLLALLNYRFIFATTTAAFPLQSKLAIIVSLAGGLFTAFSPLDTILTILSGILLGVNIVLIVKSLTQLKQAKHLHASIGGASLITIVSTGCSSCGFSVLSLVGLSSSLSFLPFHGMEVHVLSLGLLLFSSIYMLHTLRESLYCKMKK